MQFDHLSIPGPVLIRPVRHGDSRGWVSEVWRADLLKRNGIGEVWVQDNHSFSATAFTLRGLHFQTHPRAQAKLVRCTRGRVFDVAVDLRDRSPDYGRHVAIELDAENGHQLFIPKGFAHGFLTLTPDCEIQYRVSDYYSQDHESGIAWNDPALAIDWPLQGNAPVLSERDLALPALADNPIVFGNDPA